MSRFRRGDPRAPSRTRHAYELSCEIGPNGLVSGMRSKEFDPDDVLQEALKTFWQQGFEGTNMPESARFDGCRTRRVSQCVRF